MPSIKINSAINIGIEEILNGVSDLETPELEKFLAAVAQLLAKKKVKTLSKRETELLLKINKPLLSDKLQQTYNTLYEKLQNDELTPAEHSRLLTLIKKREKKGEKRLAALIELAQLKNISPKELMRQLGLL